MARAPAEEKEFPSFRNNPAKRLFVEHERRASEEALERVRGEWGRVYPLQLGDETVPTQDVAPSVSPSHPDASHPVAWVHRAGLQETERAINLANEAMQQWACTSIEERVTIGIRVADILRKQQSTFRFGMIYMG